MKLIYDRQTDTLAIILADVLVADSDEDKPVAQHFSIAELAGRGSAGR